MRATPLVFLTLLAALACAMEPTSTDLDPALLSKGKGGGSSGPTDPTATWYIPVDRGLSLRSDNQYVSGDSSAYANGVCGVTAKIFATEAASNSGDATINMDAPKRGCGRRVMLVYPGGLSETIRTFGNLRNLQNTSTAIPIGDTETRTLAISPGNLSNNPSRCDRLLFGEGGQGNGVGSDRVLVTRIDAKTWRVWSDPYSTKLAWCEKENALLEMTVDFTIVASEDLPTILP